MGSANTDYLFKVMGQLQAALAPLSDEEDVKITLSQLPQIVVLGGQVAKTVLQAILTPQVLCTRPQYEITCCRALAKAPSWSLLLICLASYRQEVACRPDDPCCFGCRTTAAHSSRWRPSKTPIQKRTSSQILQSTLQVCTALA